MRHVVLIYSLIFLFTFDLTAQVIGSFEAWDTLHPQSYEFTLINEHGIEDPMGGIPTDWQPETGIGITRTTDAYSGDHSIIIHNWYHYVNDGIKYVGKLDQRPTGISGYYKFIIHNADPDSLFAKAEVRLFNGEEDTLAFVTHRFRAVDMFDYFEIPINLDSNVEADSIEVMFRNTEFYTFCQSPVCNFLYLDDIQINSETSSVHEELAELKVFPNPSSDILNIEGNLSPGFQVLIYDNKGSLLRQFRDQKLLRIDGIESGIYTLRIIDGGNTLIKKIVKI